MHWCYHEGTDCADGFVGDLASSWHSHGVINVTAAAGVEPESAAALSSGVGHSCEGARMLSRITAPVTLLCPAFVATIM